MSEDLIQHLTRELRQLQDDVKQLRTDIIYLKENLVKSSIGIEEAMKLTGLSRSSITKALLENKIKGSQYNDRQGNGGRYVMNRQSLLDWVNGRITGTVTLRPGVEL